MSSEANSTRRISKETMERLAGKKKAGSLRCDTCFFYDAHAHGLPVCRVTNNFSPVNPSDWCAEHRLTDYGTTRS